MKDKIIVHCLVKNEENFIWYALNSVLAYVDKIMVWDTGSEDNTVQIVKSINSPKIEFKEVGWVDKYRHSQMRNNMLEATTKSDYRWLMILDGDEIWPADSIKKVVNHLKTHPNTQAVFVRTINSIGDVYHRRSESFGHYKIKGTTGHLNLRFFNLSTIRELHVELPHGRQGYFSNNHTPVQELPAVDFVDTSYLHTTHLKRSSYDNSTLKRRLKRKYELGSKVSHHLLPEIIFSSHPAIVPEISKPMGILTYLLCIFLTIPRAIKRILIAPKEGY